MLKTLQLGVGAAVVGATGLLGFSAQTPAEAQPQQNGLVNVALVDTTVQVPIGVAANVCDVNVAVLAGLLDLGPTDCGADATASAVDADGGNGPARQRGLVNIYAEDTTIQVPVGIAANLCDINAAVLARAADVGGATCDAVAEPSAEG